MTLNFTKIFQLYPYILLSEKFSHLGAQLWLNSLRLKIDPRKTFTYPWESKILVFHHFPCFDLELKHGFPWVPTSRSELKKWVQSSDQIFFLYRRLLQTINSISLLRLVTSSFKNRVEILVKLCEHSICFNVILEFSSYWMIAKWWVFGANYIWLDMPSHMERRFTSQREN